MFLKQSVSHGKIFLSFVQGYRDENGKIKHRTVAKIGYLDQLEKEYDNPIAHFREIAKQKNNDQITEYTIKNLTTKEIEMNSRPKNLGYVVLKKIYNELGIEPILKKIQKDTKIQFQLNDILSLLVYMRILKPGSKKETFENKVKIY